jgi:hypothetical protein
MKVVDCSLSKPVVSVSNSNTLREYLDQTREILPTGYYELRRALMYLTDGTGKIDEQTLYKVDCSWWAQTAREMCRWIKESPELEHNGRGLFKSDWWNPIDDRYYEISSRLDTGYCTYGDHLDLLIRYLNRLNPNNDCLSPILCADKSELINFRIASSRYRTERSFDGVVFPYKSIVALTDEIDLNTTTRYYLGGIAPVWVIPPDEERPFDGSYANAFETAYHDIRHVWYDPTQHYALNRIPLLKIKKGMNRVELPWDYSEQQMEFQLSLATQMIKTWRALQNERRFVPEKSKLLWDAATFHIIHEGIYERVEEMSDTPIFSPAFGAEYLSSAERRKEFTETMWEYSFGRGFINAIYKEHLGEDKFGKKEFERGCIEYLEALSLLRLG